MSKDITDLVSFFYDSYTQAIVDYDPERVEIHIDETEGTIILRLKEVPKHVF